MIFTFYSFKGGVGRSMSMANMAEIFYQAGLSVLIVDWDLEAPGLERFFPEIQAKAIRRPGIMDMLSDYKRIMARPLSRASGDGEGLPFESLNDYLVPVYEASGENGGRPSLSLMTAGRRDDDHFGSYSQNVLRFDWREFYDRWAGESFFEWLRKSFTDHADVVLIDSRTGVTEIGGVCTYQLADAVIMFCASNDQNMDGTFEMARKFSNEALVKYRHGRQLEVVIVPSRVDLGDSVLVDRFQKRFIDRFKEFKVSELPGGDSQFWNLNIPYASSYAFEESVAARHSDLASARTIYEAYITLAQAMTQMAGDESLVRGSLQAINELSRRTTVEGGTISAARPDTPIPSPYKGLEYYDESDAELFFGRRALVGRLVEGLANGNIMGFVGASGSGKTSAIRAGLIPALKGYNEADSKPPLGSERWPVHLITPTARPMTKLANSLLIDTETTAAAARKMADMAVMKPELLVEGVRNRLGAQDANRLLLVVDQVEELFTECKDAGERDAFINALVTIAKSDLTSLVLVMRSDFSTQAAAYSDLIRQLEVNIVSVSGLTREEIRNLIELPARLYNIAFEPGLVQRILDDLVDDTGQAGPGVLPLLSYTLKEMWNRRDGAVLTHDAYEAGGGMFGSLAETAEQTYKEFDANQRSLARNLMLRLVEVGVNSSATRRTVPITDLLPSSGESEATQKNFQSSSDLQLLQKFTNARIITIDEGSVEITHEALIHNWPRLQTWIDEGRETLLAQRRLDNAAREWEEQNRNQSLLYTGTRLVEAEEWAGKAEGSLTELERSFLELSQEYAAWQKRQSRLRLAGFIVIFVALVVTGIYAYLQFSAAASASSSSLFAKADTLAAQSLNALDEDRDLALLLARQAVELTLESEGYASDEATAALYQAVRTADWTLVPPETTRPLSTISPDGTKSAEVAETGLVVVRNLNDDTVISVIPGHDGGINSLAFSPLGGHLLTAGNDNTAHLNDVTTGLTIAVLEPLHGPVRYAIYSTDGKILTLDDTGLSAIWFQDGGLINYLESVDVISTAAFTPDGSHVVTGDSNGIIRFWSAEDGSSVREFEVGVKPVTHLDIQPNGEKIVTIAGEGQSIALWTIGGQKVADVNSHDSPIIHTAFSPDSRSFLTVGLEGPTRIWNSDDGSLMIEFNWREPGLQLTYLHDIEGGAQMLAQPQSDGTSQIWFVWDDVPGALTEAAASLNRDMLTEAECIQFQVKDLPVCP